MSITASELYVEILDYLADEDGVLPESGEEISEYDSDGDGTTGWSDLVEAFPWRKDEEKVIVLPSGKLELLDHRSGGEEEGTVMWLILKFTSNEDVVQFFKKDGWHQSFVGGEWEGAFREVSPKTCQVTYYE